MARAGIMDMNDYFNSTDSATQLMNDSFGIFPTLTANNPVATYPYPGFGGMVDWKSKAFELEVGIFQGNPQHLKTVFRQGYMLIAEFSKQVSNKIVLKGGAWHYQQSSAIGKTSNGLYASSEVNWSKAARDFNAFLQLGANPDNKSIVPYYLGLGLKTAALFPARDKDSLTIGLARAWIKNKSQETAYEIVYTLQLTKEVSLLPDLQYITHPGGIYRNAFVGILRFHIDIT